MRTEPVDVAVDGRAGRHAETLAGQTTNAVDVLSVAVRRRRVHRLIQVKGQVVDDVTRLRHRRRHRRNEPIQTRLRQTTKYRRDVTMPQHLP